jgi:hypothetical protein
MRTQLILPGLFLIVIVFMGCTIREIADNLSNQDSNHSPELSSTPFVLTIEMPVSTSVMSHDPHGYAKEGHYLDGATWKFYSWNI